MTDEKTIRETLRRFILNDIAKDPGYPLQDDENIIDAGLMDSFALAEFGVFVDKTYKVYIPDPELTVANMGTLNQMVARVLAGLS